MSLQQVDDVLGLWKTRLSTMAANLLELQCDAAYQSLTGTGGLERAQVIGATERRVGDALRQMNSLFLQFGALQAVVDRAEELRRGLPALFGAESRLREIEQLLYGRSVDAGAPDGLQADRHLLVSHEAATRVSPEEMLRCMSGTFAVVREAVTEVGEAWSVVTTRTEALHSDVQALRSQTAMPSRLIAPTLEALEQRLAAVLEQAKADPIGAVTALSRDVEPAIASARERVAAALRLAEQLKTARVRLAVLRDVHEQARARSDAVRARIYGETQICYEAGNEDTVQALAEWLGRLERRADDGLQEAVGVGLRRWQAAADSFVAREKAALEACDRALASRGELRGRFDALKAKARAYGLTGQEHFSAICGHAERVLYARPVDLQQAAQALAIFEHQLSAARRQEERVGVAR